MNEKKFETSGATTCCVLIWLAVGLGSSIFGVNVEDMPLGWAIAAVVGAAIASLVLAIDMSEDIFAKKKVAGKWVAILTALVGSTTLVNVLDFEVIWSILIAFGTTFITYGVCHSIYDDKDKKAKDEDEPKKKPSGKFPLTAQTVERVPQVLQKKIRFANIAIAYWHKQNLYRGSTNE